MNDKVMGVLNTKNKAATVYAITEKIYELVVNFLINFVVIRMLSIESYAVITVIAGYSTIVGFVNIAPESHLFKIFHTLTDEQLKKKVHGYISFDFMKALIIEVVYIVIGIYLANVTKNYQYIYYAFFFGISQIEEMFWQLFRMILELRYQQKRLIVVTMIARSLKFIFFLVFFQLHSLLLYILVNIAMTLLELVCGLLFFCGKDKWHSIYNRKKFSLKEIKDSMTQFAVLNHISGVLNSIIYSSDTVFLQFFVSQTLVGRYGVVLSGLNYINLIFQVLQKQVSIALGNSGDYEINRTTISRFMKLSVGGSVFVVFAYFIAGQWALKFYAGDLYIDEMYFWGIFILIGTSIFNAIRPMFSYIIYKGDLNMYLLKVLIPIFIIMVLTYYILSKFFGVIGMAIANTIVYGIWGISIIFSYYHRNSDC